MNFLVIIVSLFLISSCVSLPKDDSRRRKPPIIIDGPKGRPRLPLPIPLPREKTKVESSSLIRAEFSQPGLNEPAIEGQKEAPVVRPLPRLKREGERKRQLWWPGRVSDDLLSEEEILRRLGITLQTLTRLREMGLPYFEPIKLKRFYFEEDVLEWMMKYGEHIKR